MPVTESDIEKMSLADVTVLHSRVVSRHQQLVQQATDQLLKTMVESNSEVDPKQVLTERSRTIDQVKRVYAVIMGFALTSCFGNIFKGIVASEYDFECGSIFLADGLTLLSLATLFYLGSERMLDVRYLRDDSDPAKIRWFLLDLIWLRALPERS